MKKLLFIALLAVAAVGGAKATNYYDGDGNLILVCDQIVDNSCRTFSQTTPLFDENDQPVTPPSNQYYH